MEENYQDYSPPEKSSKPLVFIVIFGVLIVIGVVSYFLFFSDGKNKSGLEGIEGAENLESNMETNDGEEQQGEENGEPVLGVEEETVDDDEPEEQEEDAPEETEDGISEEFKELCQNALSSIDYYGEFEGIGNVHIEDCPGEPPSSIYWGIIGSKCACNIEKNIEFGFIDPEYFDYSECKEMEVKVSKSCEGMVVGSSRKEDKSCVCPEGQFMYLEKSCQVVCS